MGEDGLFAYVFRFAWGVFCGSGTFLPRREL